MTKREELEAAFAKAEAVLTDAALKAAKADGNRAEANAKLDKARAYCRQLRAALVELNRSDSTEAAKREASASPPSTQLSEHSVHGENKTAQDESGQRKPIPRFNVGFSAQEPSPRDAPARPPILRQTIGLLALTLTYLLYFHIDVQLQIVMLPSIFFPLSP